MGFKFLDSLALGAIGSPILGAAPIVGTGLAVFGVYKLVKCVIFDESKVETPKTETFDCFDDGCDDAVTVNQMPYVEEVKENKEKTIGDIAKYVGWIFGGMIVKDACHVIKTWGYRHMIGKFSDSTSKLYDLWASINRSMGDIQKLASCADDGKRIGMEKSVEFVFSNLLRDGFYTWRKIS